MGINGPTQPNRTGKATASDVVMTPTSTAKWIVDRYKPSGKMLEPCRGDGAFFDLMEGAEWCEITEGKDFFDYTDKVDWIITNPPFSIYDAFLEHCFDVADNIVLFIPLTKVFKSIKIDKMTRAYGGMKEIVHMGGGGRHGLPVGFPVGCVYFKRGYDGPISYDYEY